MSMDPNSIGNNGFFWFVGQVEDRNDPLKMGRVRVRIYGLHALNLSLAPVDSLPWATIMMPPTNPGVQGFGATPVGLVPGSTVVGFFMDGADKQVPVVMGTIYGVNDIDGASRYDFPFLQTITYEGGHQITINNKSSDRAISVRSGVGSLDTMQGTGDRLMLTAKNKTELTFQDSTDLTQGNKTLVAQKDLTLVAKGNVSLLAGGSVTIIAGKAFTVQAGSTGTIKSSVLFLN